MSERIDGMAGVQAVTSYATMVSTAVPPEYLGSVADNFYSSEYARIIATTTLPNEGESSFQLVERVREAAADCYGDADTYLIGQSANLYDMKQTVVSDNERVDRLTLISIFVVLLLIFRSIPIALIALVTIKAAIFINTGLPYFMGQELTFIGFMIMSIIMMGSAIDYGILLIDHYLEERKAKPKIAAMQAALPQAIPAMLVSALILAGAGLTLGFTSSNALVGPLGILLGRGALIAFVISITLLPALLLVCDRIIPPLSLRIKFYQGAE